MTARETGTEPRPTGRPRRVASATEVAPPLDPRVAPDRPPGRHAALAPVDGRRVQVRALDFDDDSWQREEIEGDRRRERRLIWQSLIALVVVAALVLAGRVQGW